MPYLSVDASQRIYYEHAAGEDTTVVLLHGWGMSGRVWDATARELAAAGVGVVRYDQRGCGLSDREFADVAIETLAADLVALCDHLALAAPVLNGWSLGGAVAVDAAVRLGARLQGLVLTCGATPRYTRADDFPFGGSADDVGASLAALRTNRHEFLRALYFDNVFARAVGDTVKQRFYEIALQASPHADASLGALGALDQRALLPRIDAPALVVTGIDDRVVAPAIARCAARALPDAELLEMPGCGHAPFVDVADTYHAALLRFIARLRATRR